MHGGLLKHTPSSSTAAASSSSDQNSSNAQTTLPTIPRGQLVLGPKDQLRLLSPVGATVTTNHIAAPAGHAPRHSGRGSDEEDGGGGRAGARVKKKRKKKEKREKEKEERESRKPKKRREEKEREKEVETTPPLSRRWKEGRKASQRVELKRAAERKDLSQVPVKVPAKRGRKPKIKIIPPAPPPGTTAPHLCFISVVI